MNAVTPCLSTAESLPGETSFDVSELPELNGTFEVLEETSGLAATLGLCTHQKSKSKAPKVQNMGHVWQ